MAKKELTAEDLIEMTAEDLFEWITAFEEVTRVAEVREVLDELEDFFAAGPDGDDPDTWKAGFSSAIDVIRTNFNY